MGDWPDPMAPSDYAEQAREIADASGSLEELREKAAARRADVLPGGRDPKRQWPHVGPPTHPLRNVLEHIAHVVLVERGARDLDHQAVCACGWKGDVRPTSPAAWADVDAHEDANPLETT
jgi:hypothetical protein